MSKEYLGNSVYVDIDDCATIVLTTENGLGASNRIALEPEVYQALVEYLTAWRSEGLYQAAKYATHRIGATWTDPRTGVSYPPPPEKADGH